MADLIPSHYAPMPSRYRASQWRVRGIGIGSVLVLLLALLVSVQRTPDAPASPVPVVTRDQRGALVIPPPVISTPTPTHTTSRPADVRAGLRTPGEAAIPATRLPPEQAPAPLTPPVADTVTMPLDPGTATPNTQIAPLITAVVMPVPPPLAGHLTQFEIVGPDRFWIVVDDALLETIDHGQHWQTRFHGRITAISFVTARLGWIATETAILATHDGGQTWQPQYQASAFVQLLGFASARPGWIMDGGTLLMTLDGGQTWQPRSTPQPIYNARFLDASHGWGFFRSISQQGGTPELAWTQDAGQQWEARTAPECEWFKGGGAFSASSPHTVWIACAEVPGAGIGVQIGRTTDNGLTWHIFDAAGAFARDLTTDQHALFFLDRQHGWLGADTAWAKDETRDYLFQATDDGGRTWQPRSLLGQRAIRYDKTYDDIVSGMLDFRFTSALHGYARYGAGFYDEGDTLLETWDGGRQWTALYGAPPTPAGPLHFFDVAQGVSTSLPWDRGAFLHTSDGGRTWHQLSTLTGLCTVGVLGGIRDLSFSDRTHGWALADCVRPDQAGSQISQILTYTSDGGATWRVRAVGLSTRDVNRGWQSVSFFNLKSGYLASNGATLPPTDPARHDFSTGTRTDDGGFSFHPVDSPPWPVADQIRFVNASHGWRRTGRTLWATADGGRSWQQLDPTEVQDMDLHAGGVGWILTRAPALDLPALVATMDGGQTWTRYAFAHLTPQRVSFADRQHGWVADGRHLYATTDGGASWAQVH